LGKKRWKGGRRLGRGFERWGEGESRRSGEGLGGGEEEEEWLKGKELGRRNEGEERRVGGRGEWGEHGRSL